MFLIRLRQIIRHEFLMILLVSLVVVTGLLASGRHSEIVPLHLLSLGYLFFGAGYFIHYVAFRMPDVYKHYKNGALYEELYSSKVSMLEEDQAQVVIYRQLSRRKRPLADIWVRRYSVFHEIIPGPKGNRCRFKRII